MEKRLAVQNVLVTWVKIHRVQLHLMQNKISKLRYLLYHTNMVSKVITILYLLFLPPANVVCEGYIFTGVCDSVKRGGAWLLRGGGRRAWLLPGGAYVVAWAGGGHAWFLPGGGHAWFFPGGGVRRIRRDTVNERAVRILLECILVDTRISELLQGARSACA